MKKFAWLAVLAAVVAGPASAMASPLSVMVYNVPDRTYQNTVQNPCVFYGPGTCPLDPSPWPAPASPTNGAFSPLTQTYDLVTFDSASNTTLSDWNKIVGGTFVLGLDINQSVNPQTLTNFTIAFNGVTAYSLPLALSVPDSANGVGWADYVLAAGCSGSLVPAIFTGSNPNIFGCSGGNFQPFMVPAGTTSISFGLSYGTTGNDGPDKIFAIPAAAASVPEPASLILLGTGLIGSGVLARRWKRDR